MEPFAKGKRGLIYLKEYKGKKIIIKKKNPKSTAISRIEIEASFLKKLNRHNIGPKFIYYKDDELAMEYIEGIPFEDYIKTNNPKKVIKDLMLQLFQMDKLGINKEEMHHPRKHIIVRKNKPVLIDFERCHYTEKPQNVTQFIEYLRKLNFKVPDKELIKRYKEKINKENFQKLLI